MQSAPPHDQLCSMRFHRYFYEKVLTITEQYDILILPNKTEYANADSMGVFVILIKTPVLHLLMLSAKVRFCLATIGVCVFCASTPVGALFYFERREK